MIDQFEEVFTLVEDEDAPAHFLGASRPPRRSAQPPARGRHAARRLLRPAAAVPGFAELLQVARRGRRAAVGRGARAGDLGPGRARRRLARAGLVAAMLADVAEEPGALPLLEYALTELFERRDGRTLFLEAYRQIGGVSGALGATGRGALRGARRRRQGGGAAAVPAAGRARRGDGGHAGAACRDRRSPRSTSTSRRWPRSSTVRRSRQLSFDRDARTGAPTIELAHEAMLTAWPRLHRLDRRGAGGPPDASAALAAAARDWIEADRDPSFLLGGSRLEQAEAWQADSGIAVTPEEREYLDASRAERERRTAEEEARAAHEQELERRSFRRLRALVAVLAVAALVAGALTAIVTNQRNEAERARLETRARQSGRRREPEHRSGTKRPAGAGGGRRRRARRMARYSGRRSRHSTGP